MAAIRRWHRAIRLPLEAWRILDGVVAGDGSLTFRGAQTALSVTGKHREWIEHLHRLFRDWGLRPKLRQTKSGHWEVRTAAFAALTPLYRRWYCGARRLPLPLIVTRAMVLYWYLGDGALKTGHGSCSAEIGAYAYSPLDVVRVAEEIARKSRCRVRVYQHKAGCVISIAAQSVPRFLQWIGACPVPCYGYKWAHTVKPTVVKDLCQLPRMTLRQLDRQWKLAHGRYRAA